MLLKPLLRKVVSTSAPFFCLLLREQTLVPNLNCESSGKSYRSQTPRGMGL